MITTNIEFYTLEWSDHGVSEFSSEQIIHSIWHLRLGIRISAPYELCRSELCPETLEEEALAWLLRYDISFFI